MAESGGGAVTVETALGPVRAPGAYARGSAVVVAVRPEAMRLGMPADPAFNRLDARVREIAFLGSRTQLSLDLQENGADHGVVELPRLPDGVGPGQVVSIAFRVADTMVFPGA